jgi:signal transduction histidine kinase
MGQIPAMSAIAQIHLRAEEPVDRPQTERQLREAHKMEAIGRLVGGVAHDFNNLLTGMVLCSELILAGLEKNHRLRRFAEEICKAGEQGAGLIQQLMAVARQQVVEPRLLSLNEVVSDVRNLLTRLISPANPFIMFDLYPIIFPQIDAKLLITMDLCSLDKHS